MLTVLDKNLYRFSSPVEVAGELQGLVTVPDDFDPAKESLPVILALHGAGERGEDLNAMRVHGVGKIFSRDPNHHGLRVITLCPQCPFNMLWTHLVYPLKSWLTAAMQELNGDWKRLSVTGLSMGGYGTWEMLMTFPDLFSCGAPVCGDGTPWRASALKDKPIWVFHGIDDAVVPVSGSIEMTAAARAQGADVKLTLYDQVGHGSWVKAYEQTDLIEWLVAHTLP